MIFSVPVTIYLDNWLLFLLRECWGFSSSCQGTGGVTSLNWTKLGRFSPKFTTEIYRALHKPTSLLCWLVYLEFFHLPGVWCGDKGMCDKGMAFPACFVLSRGRLSVDSAKLHRKSVYFCRGGKAAKWSVHVIIPNIPGILSEFLLCPSLIPCKGLRNHSPDPRGAGLDWGALLLPLLCSSKFNFLMGFL